MLMNFQRNMLCFLHWVGDGGNFGDMIGNRCLHLSKSMLLRITPLTFHGEHQNQTGTPQQTHQVRQELGGCDDQTPGATWYQHGEITSCPQWLL